MQIAKIVNKVFAPVMKEIGFERLPSRRPGGGDNIWVFGTKIDDNVFHVVQVYSKAFPFGGVPDYEMSTTLFTTFPNGCSVNLAWLLDNMPPGIANWQKRFSTEQQVEDYLTLAAKAVVEYAVPLFPCFDRTGILVPKDLFEKMAEGTEERAEKFQAEHGVAFEADIDGVKQNIVKTEEVLKTVQFQPLEKVAGLLVDATAFWGEQIRRVHGGEWTWTDTKRAYYTCAMGTYNLTHYFFSNVGLHPDSCCNGFLNPLGPRKVVVEQLKWSAHINCKDAQQAQRVRGRQGWGWNYEIG
jgi:hypothetical protein